jgi:hypothetical protein
MPQHRKPEPYRDVCFRLPVSMMNKVDIILANPVTGKPPLGRKSKMVERWFREWIAQQTGEPTK